MSSAIVKEAEYIQITFFQQYQVSPA